MWFQIVANAQAHLHRRNGSSHVRKHDGSCNYVQRFNVIFHTTRSTRQRTKKFAYEQPNLFGNFSSILTALKHKGKHFLNTIKAQIWGEITK